MITKSSTLPTEKTRREFFQQSGKVAAGTALAGALVNPSSVHAAPHNTLKLALVGCGGRGSGAAVNALATSGPTKLWAMADLFADRLRFSLQQLTQRFPEQVDVPAARQFLGFDAYRHAIDAVAEGDVVLLATPPAFRPLHLEYAVEQQRHVFMEKSFAVDAPGVRRVLKAGEEASRSNLKIAGGLMSRHYRPLEEAVARVHEGDIGEPITCWAYRQHGPVGLVPPRGGTSELAHQIRNYSCFTWLNGGFILDWLIHNLDVCCWVKDAWPVSAQGQGGRQVRREPDQLFDHYVVEYTFEDGTRLIAQGRHMASCWNFFGNVIHGSRGSAVLGEGVAQPRLYRGYEPAREQVTWQYTGPPCNAYQAELDLLFRAIREDLPYNETERCAKAALVGIMGRMAAYTGQRVTWEEALASDFELAPGLNQMVWDSNAPVMPDAEGRYPIAMPGLTKQA